MDVTAILLVILGIPSTGGLFVAARAAIRWLSKGRKGRRAEVESRRIHDDVAAANASVLVVAQSQQQLVADNARLRVQLAESDARHAAERAEWMADKAQMRAEIDDMEIRLRTAMDRLNEALAEVHEWRRKHGSDTAT